MEMWPKIGAIAAKINEKLMEILATSWEKSKEMKQKFTESW